MPRSYDGRGTWLCARCYEERPTCRDDQSERRERERARRDRSDCRSRNDTPDEEGDQHDGKDKVGRRGWREADLRAVTRRRGEPAGQVNADAETQDEWHDNPEEVPE